MSRDTGNSHLPMYTADSLVSPLPHSHGHHGLSPYSHEYHGTNQAYAHNYFGGPVMFHVPGETVQQHKNALMCRLQHFLIGLTRDDLFAVQRDMHDLIWSIKHV